MYGYIHSFICWDLDCKVSKYDHMKLWLFYAFLLRDFLSLTQRESKSCVWNKDWVVWAYCRHWYSTNLFPNDVLEEDTPVRGSESSSLFILSLCHREFVLVLLSVSWSSICSSKLGRLYMSCDHFLQVITYLTIPHFIYSGYVLPCSSVSCPKWRLLCICIGVLYLSLYTGLFVCTVLYDRADWDYKVSRTP